MPKATRRVLRTSRRRITDQPTRKRPPRRRPFSRVQTSADRRLHQPCIVNQTTAATTTATITAQTTGETFLELPLRGESFAAWLNSVFIACSVGAMSAKDAADLVPQRLVFAIGICL